MSADQEDGLIEQVGAEDAGAEPDAELTGSRTARIRALRRRHAVTVLALSCAVFALAAAAFAWTTTRSHDRADRAEARLRSVSQVLGAGDVHLGTAPLTGIPGATLTAYYSPTRTGILVAATGLSAPPHGHVYELWYTDTATMSPLARFTTLTDISTLTRPATGPGTLLLTLEPAAGAARPAAPPIATISLAG